MGNNDSDFGGSPWALSPQGTMTPSPGTAAASPEEAYHDGHHPATGSFASSRSSSHHNLPNLSISSGLADIPTPRPTSEVPAPKKTHSRQQSTASAAATPAVTPAASTADAAPATVCINCKTTNTPLWRRDENGQPLCNACQLFRKLHGSDRPVSLHNSVIKKRNRTRNPAKDAPKKAGARTQARRGSGAGTATAADTSVTEG